MNFFWIWAYTILLTGFLEHKRRMSFFKFIGDCGYRFDYYKKDKLIDIFDGFHLPVTLLSLIVPFYNIFTSFVRYGQYVVNKDIIVDKVEEDNFLIKMSLEEEKKFRKFHNGSMLNRISKKNKDKIPEELGENVSKIAYDDGTIYYIVHDLDNIEIVKVEGTMCELSEEELIKKVKSYETMLCDFDSKEEISYKTFDNNHNEIEILSLYYDDGVLSYYFNNNNDIVIVNLTGELSKLTNEELVERIQHYIYNSDIKMTLKK